MQCTRKFLSTHDGFGHLTSCRLISPYSAQMACDYARLSRDYSAAEIERETERVKINSSNKEKSWHKMKWKHEVCEVRQLEGGWWCGATSFTSTTNMQSNVTNNLVARHKTAKIWAPFSRSASCLRLCVCVCLCQMRKSLACITTRAFVISSCMTWWIVHVQVKHSQKGDVKNDPCFTEPTPLNSWCVYRYSLTWKIICQICSTSLSFRIIQFNCLFACLWPKIWSSYLRENQISGDC